MRNFIIFKIVKITEILASPPNSFCLMKNVCTENLPLCKNCTSTKWYQQASDSVFTENFHHVYSRFQHKVSVALETHQVPVLAFLSQLRGKLTWWLSSACLCLVIRRKLLNNYCFGNSCHDVIGSNLVLVVSTLRYICLQHKHFWMCENRKVVILKIL